MSAAVLIALIIVLLVALLAYAFVSQTIANKQQQHPRLLAALKQRAANLKQMINS